jgi:hypothetical protein
MKPAEQEKFLDTMPEGVGKESWRRAFAAVNPLRNNPAPTDLPASRVWTPPAGADTPNTHVDPTKHPLDNRDFPYHHPYPIYAPRALSYNQYWQYWARSLVSDPVTESTDPYRIRLELGTLVPPWQSRPYLPIPGGFCYAWRTVATMIEHLRTGDLITVSAYQFKNPWTPGLYIPRGDVQAIHWMSRTA